MICIKVGQLLVCGGLTSIDGRRGGTVSCGTATVRGGNVCFVAELYVEEIADVRTWTDVGAR